MQRTDSFENTLMLGKTEGGRRREQQRMRRLDGITNSMDMSLKKSSLDSKKIQPLHPQGNQPWIFIGRPDVEAETPIVWPTYAKNWPIWKYPDVGKDWRREKKGTTEDEKVGCITNSIYMSLSSLRKFVMDREAWRAAVHGVANKYPSSKVRSNGCTLLKQPWRDTPRSR